MVDAPQWAVRTIPPCHVRESAIPHGLSLAEMPGAFRGFAQQAGQCG